MTKQKYAIYVHIPFCKARCGYCAFSSCCDFSLCEKYFEVLCSEIRQAEVSDDIVIKTMFWGGGTPSSVPLNYLQKLYSALKTKFDLSLLEEFTVECNPESTTEELLYELKSFGVTRISFGLQSVNDTTLARIGRLHNYEQFLTALMLARQNGFDINADLILGLPESETEYKNSINTVSKLDLQHISLYALEIHEENTAFKNLCSKYEFTEDQLADMYDYARRVFKDFGFERYEVSNFAKRGCECKHNLTYWTENRYFGFGAAASGFVGNVRYGNAYGIADYITNSKREYYDVIEKREEMCEYVMLGLRLQKGISLSDFSERYGEDFTDVFPATHSLVERGFLAVSGGRVFLPDDKFYVLNSILVELLPD